MFSTVIDKAVGIVDSRFLLVAFFPVIVFVAAAALLLVRLDSALLSKQEKAWDTWSGPQQWSTVVAGVAASFVLAYVVFVNITPIIRIFEGYFGPLAWLGELFDLGREDAGDPLGYLTHPGDEERFPTRLGNSLRAAEVHPRKAYAMDSVVLWPRLVAVLPETLRKSIDGARMALDFLIVIVAGATAFAVFGGAAVAVEDGGRGLWLSVVGGSLLVAYLAYSGAVSAARDYGDQVRAAFDLYRFELLSSLRLPLPMNRPEERRLWTEINELVRSSEAPNWWLFDHPAPK